MTEKLVLDMPRKVHLSLKFGLLNKMIVNDELSIPGYVYEEATKTTFRSPMDCAELLEFLLLCVASQVPREKVKALKLTKYLAKHGDDRFSQDLRKKDRIVKEAAGFGDPTDSSLSMVIRNEAKELLNSLFQDMNESPDHFFPLLSEPKPPALSLGGMGSYGMPHSQQHGKYKGFGNLPVSHNKNMMDKMLDGLSEMVEKVTSSAPEDKMSEVIRSELQLDKGNYCPAPVPRLPSSSDVTTPLPLVTTQTPQKPTRKILVAGRPGGGWDDSEGEDVEENDSATSARSRRQHPKTGVDGIDTCSLETGDAGLKKTGDEEESELGSCDNIVAEKQFVEELSSSPYRSWHPLDTLCRRFASLNCQKILEFLRTHLQSSLSEEDEIKKMNILLLIEALLYEDVLPVETLYATFHPTLLKLTTTDLVALKAKSRKIAIILEKLMDSQTTVLSTSHSS